MTTTIGPQPAGRPCSHHQHLFLFETNICVALWTLVQRCTGALCSARNTRTLRVNTITATHRRYTTALVVLASLVFFSYSSCDLVNWSNHRALKSNEIVHPSLLFSPYNSAPLCSRACAQTTSLVTSSIDHPVVVVLFFFQSALILLTKSKHKVTKYAWYVPDLCSPRTQCLWQPPP